MFLELFKEIDCLISKGMSSFTETVSFKKTIICLQVSIWRAPTHSDINEF